jgi:hypothetical protein
MKAGVVLAVCAWSAASAQQRDPALQPFAATSPWNTPIAADAVFSQDGDPMTRDLLAGHALIHAGTWSMPIFLAHTRDPWVVIHDEENARDFRAQVPAAAKPDRMGDAHLFVIDPAHRFVMEMYRAQVFSDRHIVARRAFRIDLAGPGMFLHDGKFPGVRAMDASGVGGILRAWEMQAGHIRHALTFLLPYGRLKHGPVWPSSREDFWGFRDYKGSVPVGTLIAIPRNVDVEKLGLSDGGLALAHALQDYGAYCDDSVGTDGIVLSAETASEGSWPLVQMRRDFPLLHLYLRAVLNNHPRG